jgi:hypothetical protein
MFASFAAETGWMPTLEIVATDASRVAAATAI